MIDKNRVKKILIIKPRGIGDVVLSTIVFKNLVHNFPEANIDFLTEKPSNFLLTENDYLNKIIVINKKKVTDRIKQFYQLKKEKYDLVFDFYSTPLTAQYTFASKAKYRVGFPLRGRKFAYNLFGPEIRDNVHAALLHNEVLKSVGLEIISDSLELKLSNSDINIANNFKSNKFNSDDKIIGISPSGGWQSKKCPANKFIEYCEEINKKYKVKFLIVWGPGDEIDAELISSKVDNAIMAPPTSITEMAAMMKICDAVIANDSGPMHISAALSVPTISIHGPTNHLLQGPYGSKHKTVRLDELDCINCNLLECPKQQECFNDLPVSKILNTLEQLIVKNNLKIDERN